MGDVRRTDQEQDEDSIDLETDPAPEGPNLIRLGRSEAESLLREVQLLSGLLDDSDPRDRRSRMGPGRVKDPSAEEDRTDGS